MPKKEFDKTWYDSHYAQNIKQKGEYSEHYSASRYLPLWELALCYIDASESIADFGCGVGAFASMLYDRKMIYSYGVDFSEVAIKQAKKNVKKWSDKFFVGDLYDESTFKLKPYSCAVMFEVLEHIKNDIGVLGNIKRNTHVIFSLPSFDYKSHVRFFKNKNQIKNRYSSYIKIKWIKPVETPQTIWLVNGYV